MSITVGIDTGGTFTDLVAVDDESGRWHVAKVPSNPDNPVAAIDASLGRAGFDPADVDFVVVGTTIGINAVLTRRGARVVYLTTEGFEDIPYIQRINRKHHYDFHWRKPTPLVHRPRLPRCRRAHGRGGSRARPDRPRGARRRRSQAGRRRGRRTVPAVAVCFLFSYLNPEHELRDARRCSRSASRTLRGLALARGRADLARVRARHDGHRGRLPQAARRALRGRRVRRRSRARAPAALGAAEVERRARARRRGARPAGAPPALGHRWRGDRRRLLRARARARPRRSRSTWAARAATSA